VVLSVFLWVEAGVNKSVQCVGEAFAKQNGKLIRRLFPRDRRHLPIFLDIAYRTTMMDATRAPVTC
jgi:hypothetical protein